VPSRIRASRVPERPCGRAAVRPLLHQGLRPRPAPADGTRPTQRTTLQLRFV